MTKEKRINVRIKEEDSDALKEISDILELPSAYLVRQAIKEKIASLRQNHPLLQKTGEAALAE